MNLKRNNELIISAVLALVLILVTVFLFFRAGNKPVTGSFFSNNIDKFCINSICVFAQNGNWLVNNGDVTAPSNKEVVKAYINKFKQIVLSEEISINKDRFAEMGIGQTNPVVLTINGKKLEIGKIDSNYDGTYVRELDGKVVYDVGVILDRDNLENSDQWINKVLTNLAVLQTKKITVTSVGNKTEVTPKDGKFANQNWAEKVDHVVGTKLLPGYKETSDVKTSFNIESETDSAQLVVGKNTNNWRNPIYWASNDEVYFYAISSDDYNLLTGKFN